MLKDKLIQTANTLNLPIRKTKSKITYVVYLLKHLIDNQECYYIGYSNDVNRRLKEHKKTKTIIEHDIIFSCNSKQNAKIIESYLIIHYKLTTDYFISNRRVENIVI
jgi:hypothetical protein